jgi:short-subunit dehydrogenase
MSNPVEDPRAGGAALVTGASAGIGTELARELARRGHTLVLVARRKARLQELATDLEDQHGVTAHVLACDLGKPAQRGRLAAQVADLGLDVDVLVNNAGFATGGAFAESDPEREVEQVRVLCEAVVALTSAFLPGMVQRGSGGVLTVASTAGMQPLPYSAGYCAAKAHALAFTEAIHHEVLAQGVHVTALCPGPVKTDFWAIAGDQPIESSIPRAAWVTAGAAARAGVTGLADNRRVVVPGRSLGLAMRAGYHVPQTIKLRAVERLMRP